MALRYTGDAGVFYPKVTVGGNYQRTLEPIPGEVYEIDDPGDGHWEAEKVQKADKGPVLPDTVKSDENGLTDAEDGK